MNFILKILSTVGKNAMSKIISTQASSHPLPDDLLLVEDLGYEGPSGAQLAADVYRPKDRSAGPLPIAVFVHGGGLFVGDRKANRAYVALLAQRGYVVYVPEYRLLDQSDGMGAIEDVCTALTFVQSTAAEYGGDLSRVLVIGESAGGLLALYATALTKSPELQAALGIKAPELPIHAFASFGGMLYTTRFDLLGLVYRRDMFGERRHNKAFMELMDPDDPRVELNLPPVLQVTSGEDFLKSYTLRFNETLTMAGHSHRLIFYKNGDELLHAFPSLNPDLPQSRQVLDELDAWFRGLWPHTSPCEVASLANGSR